MVAGEFLNSYSKQSISQHMVVAGEFLDSYSKQGLNAGYGNQRVFRSL